MLLAAISSGTRTAVLMPIIVGLSAICQRRKLGGLQFLVVLLPLAMIGGVAMSSFRGERDLGLDIQEINSKILYGENFPDFRNLAWLLGNLESDFDSQYGGLTILSSVLGFVPSSVMPWRDQFAWGNIGPEILGFDPKSHPGVRALPFTEWYYNFSIPGLVLSSFAFGYLIKICSTPSYTHHDRDRPIIAGFFIFLFFGYLVSNTPNIAACYPIYALFISICLVKAIAGMSNRRKLTYSK